jgi:ribosomal protein S18 acetylase RimI-like enzyme
VARKRNAASGLNLAKRIEFDAENSIGNRLGGGGPGPRTDGVRSEEGDSWKMISDGLAHQASFQEEREEARRVVEKGFVRVARIQEIDRVAALWALITEHHTELDPLFEMRRGTVAEGELRELLRALHRDPDAEIFVYDPRPKGESSSPGTLEGLCIVRVDRAAPILVETERAEISDLGVRPALRRRGIARRLVEEAMSWVADRGVSRIEIQVASGNQEGQAFWRSMGYTDLMDVLHKRL